MKKVLLSLCIAIIACNFMEDFNHKPIAKVQYKSNHYFEGGVPFLWVDILEVYDEESFKKEMFIEISQDGKRANMYGDAANETYQEGETYFVYPSFKNHDFTLEKEKRDWSYQIFAKLCYIVIFSLLFCILTTALEEWWKEKNP